jgi:hypothetical protein
MECGFNVGWWKHAIIPPLMQRNECSVDDIPTIVMFREPARQIVSFYKFAMKGRSPSIGGEKGFENFIRNPIYMKPFNHCVSYVFPKPLDYWIQFYWAAVQWDRPSLCFLELETLRKDTDVLAKSIASIQPGFSAGGDFALPKGYLGRNSDSHFMKGHVYEQGVTLEDSETEARAVIEQIREDDRPYLTTTLADELLSKMRHSPAK